MKSENYAAEIVAQLTCGGYGHKLDERITVETAKQIIEIALDDYAELHSSALTTSSSIIDVGEQTIDLNKVDWVGRITGDSSHERYIVHFTGGHTLMIYEEAMKRKDFVKLWKEVSAIRG